MEGSHLIALEKRQIVDMKWKWKFRKGKMKTVKKKQPNHLRLNEVRGLGGWSSRCLTFQWYAVPTFQDDINSLCKKQDKLHIDPGNNRIWGDIMRIFSKDTKTSRDFKQRTNEADPADMTTVFL